VKQYTGVMLTDDEAISEDDRQVRDKVSQKKTGVRQGPRIRIPEPERHKILAVTVLKSQ